MDKSLEGLRAKVQLVVPTERGFRTEATRYVDEMVSATRMFDASTVEYAKEIILDTQEHDATTVFELVRFMLKYRLQFASTARNPEGREIYTQLFELMTRQLKELGSNGGLVLSTEAPPAGTIMPNNMPPDGFRALFNGTEDRKSTRLNSSH